MMLRSVSTFTISVALVIAKAIFQIEEKYFYISLQDMLHLMYIIDPFIEKMMAKN